MKINKGIYLAGILTGGFVVGAYGVGCSDDSPGSVSANEAGAGGVGGSDGGMGGSGAGGDGGASGSKECEDLNIPKYICNLEEGTDPAFLDVINECIIPNHEAAQQENPRAGNAMIGTATCGACAYKLSMIRKEGAIILAMAGIYIDPFFNDKSMNRAMSVGVDYIPADNKMVEDPFPTTENPEGISTLLKRQKIGFNSLQEVAEFYGCDSSKIAAEQMMSKEEAVEMYGPLTERIDLIGKMGVEYEK